MIEAVILFSEELFRLKNRNHYWKLLDLFDVVFCSGGEGLVKPDPAAYNLTLKRLKVRLNKAVFIDDTAGHVEVAQKLGIHEIIFSNAAGLERDLKRLLDHKLRKE